MKSATPTGDEWCRRWAGIEWSSVQGRLRSELDVRFSVRAAQVMHLVERRRVAGFLSFDLIAEELGDEGWIEEGLGVHDATPPEVGPHAAGMGDEHAAGRECGAHFPVEAARRVRGTGLDGRVGRLVVADPPARC